MGIIFPNNRLELTHLAVSVSRIESCILGCLDNHLLASGQFLTAYMHCAVCVGPSSAFMVSCLCITAGSFAALLTLPHYSYKRSSLLFCFFCATEFLDMYCLVSVALFQVVCESAGRGLFGMLWSRLQVLQRHGRGVGRPCSYWQDTT